MKPKTQMIVGLILGVVLLIEGSSLVTAPRGESPVRAFGTLVGIVVLIGAPCCFFMAWKGYQKDKGSGSGKDLT